MFWCTGTTAALGRCMTLANPTLQPIQARPYRPAFLAMLAFAVAACGGSKAQRPDTTKSDSASGNVAQTYDTASYRAAFDSATKGKIKSTDSTIIIDFGRTRSQKDSFTLRAAIRNGMKRIDNWPMGPVPMPGAILPAKRIVAFYGNPLSKKMGVLGEYITRRADTKDSAGKRVYAGYETDSMLKKLDKAVKEWEEADPTTPVQPALHLIASVAQGDSGRDGKYRLRMDSTVIEEVYGWAVKR